MKKLAVVLAAAALGAIAWAPPASAGCTHEYVAALTDEGYLFYNDYPYTLWARQSTERYVECVNS